MKPDERLNAAHDAMWPDAIDRVIAGEESPNDAAVVAHWAAAYPQRAQFFAVLQSELDPPLTATFDADAMLNKIVAAERGTHRTERVFRTTSEGGDGRARRPRGAPVAGGRPLTTIVPTIVRTLLNGLTGRTVAALFGKKDTELTTTEVERLRALVKRSETESP
jgi:hypothetical protein